MSRFFGWGRYETIVPAAREAQVVRKIMKHRGFVETQRNTEVLLKRYCDIPIPHPLRSPEPFLGLVGIFTGIPSLKLTAIALGKGRRLFPFGARLPFAGAILVSGSAFLSHTIEKESHLLNLLGFFEKSWALEDSFKVFCIGCVGDPNIFAGGILDVCNYIYKNHLLGDLCASGPNFCYSPTLGDSHTVIPLIHDFTYWPLWMEPPAIAGGVTIPIGNHGEDGTLKNQPHTPYIVGIYWVYPLLKGSLGGLYS